MDKETVLEILQFQFHPQFVQVDTRVTVMETVLSHMSQSYVTLDLLAMDQEVVFQQSFQLHLHAQVDISQTDKETVFQMFNPKLLVQVDSLQTEKEIASGFQYQLSHHTIHHFQHLHKFQHQLQLQFHQLQVAHQASPLMDSETVLPHQFQ